MQTREISLRAIRASRDYSSAATVEARARTERHMHVERERQHRRTDIAGQRHLPVGLFVNGVGELNSGGIRGVARPGTVATADEVRIKQHGVHGNSSSDS